MLSKREAMIVRVVLARVARGEELKKVMDSYRNLDDEAKERIMVYVEHN